MNDSIGSDSSWDDDGPGSIEIEMYLMYGLPNKRYQRKRAGK